MNETNIRELLLETLIQSENGNDEAESVIREIKTISYLQSHPS